MWARTKLFIWARRMPQFAKTIGWIAFALLLVLTFAYRIVSSGLKTTTTAANTSGKAPVPLQEQRPQQRPETSAEELKHRNMYLDRYCARGNLFKSRYGYATVIEQTRWITNTTAKAVESFDPLIYYDNRFLWHPLSSVGCRYTCRFSVNFSDYRNALLAVFTQPPPEEAMPKPLHQIWALETGESPFHMPPIPSDLQKDFKIFLTTKGDSHVPWIYGAFVAKEEPEMITSPQQQIRILTANNLRWLPKLHARRKKKAVALISNWNARNRRIEYIKELSNHMQVEVFGNGHTPCSRNGDACLRAISHQFKFYLAFENSNCVDYITEKFFMNALGYDMVPVVMGAPRESYCALAPPNSFIHVDDFTSPAELAGYLNWLDRNDTAYASYFAWKGYGKLAENTRIDCRLCGFLHEKVKSLKSTPHKNFTYFTDKTTLCQIGNN